MRKNAVKDLCDLVEDLCEGRETYVHEYVDAALKAANHIEKLEAKLERAESLLVDAMVQLGNGKIKTRRHYAYLIGQFLAGLEGQDNA